MMSKRERTGPLTGLKVIELVGLGAGPFAAMLLADLGAEVLRIDRPDHVRRAAADGGGGGGDGGGGAIASAHGRDAYDLLARNRQSVAVDLKQPAGVALVLSLLEKSDALIEGFRPGVLERLGLGPDVCLARNPRLVYGRMTGWGQTGPLAQRAGHDIDYIALAGALHAVGRAGEAPVPPLNLIGDFGGGGMLLAFGIMCAVYETQRSGRGQVIDAAMIDGAALLMTMFYGMRAAGHHKAERGVNLLDGGAHFYDSYETSDGKHMAVGALEPQFYAQLMQRLGFDVAQLPRQMDRSSWPLLKQQLAARFKEKSRAEWTALFEDSDACVTPVLDLEEAAQHPHARARASFTTVANVLQPSAAPRFSRTPASEPEPPHSPGADTESALATWGVTPAELARLRDLRAIA